MIIKPLATETWCNTVPNTFAYSTFSYTSIGYSANGNASPQTSNVGSSTTNVGAVLLRLYNSNATTSFLVTRAVNSTVNVGTVTLGPNTVMYLQKEPTELLSSNSAANNIFCAPVAFRNGG